METTITTIIKPNTDLTPEEFRLTENAKTREWGPPPPDKKYDEKFTSILLKNKDGEILAQAELIPIDNVRFSDEAFSIIGISGVIASKKGQGYGRKLIETVTQYLTKANKTGIGFTGVPGFYEKCGISMDKKSLKRFVHITADGKKIANTTDEYVVYYEGQDAFMQKVLTNPSQKVFLPRNPDW